MLISLSCLLFHYENEKDMWNKLSENSSYYFNVSRFFTLWYHIYFSIKVTRVINSCNYFVYVYIFKVFIILTGITRRDYYKDFYHSLFSYITEGWQYLHTTCIKVISKWISKVILNNELIIQKFFPINTLKTHSNFQNGKIYWNCN